MFACSSKFGLFVLVLTAGLAAHAELAEQWGGKGAGIQVYSDHRAYFLFDCDEGQTQHWLENKTEVPGTLRSDVFKQPVFRDTTFVAERTSANTLKLTVITEGEETKTFELQRNRTPELQNCGLAR